MHIHNHRGLKEQGLANSARVAKETPQGFKEKLNVTQRKEMDLL